MKKILIFSIITILSSCVSYNRCCKKFGKQFGDSTSHEVVGNAVKTIEADTAKKDITQSDLDGLKEGESIDFESPSVETKPDATETSKPVKPRTKGSITKTKTGFEIKAITPPDTFKIEVKVPCKCPPPVVFEEPKKRWVYFFSGIALAFLVVLILALLFRR
jgi:hypothetical protein